MLDLDWSQLKNIRIGSIFEPSQWPVNCVPDGTFNIYFKQNMKKMYIPVSDDLQTNVGGVLTVLKVLSDIVTTYGKKVTLAEAIFAIKNNPNDSRIEILAKHYSQSYPAFAALYGSYVLGATFGSTIHAIINSAGCPSPTRPLSFKKEVAELTNQCFKDRPYIKNYVLDDSKVLGAVAMLGFRP